MFVSTSTFNLSRPNSSYKLNESSKLNGINPNFSLESSSHKNFNSSSIYGYEDSVFNDTKSKKNPLKEQIEVSRHGTIGKDDKDYE